MDVSSISIGSTASGGVYNAAAISTGFRSAIITARLLIASLVITVTAPYTDNLTKESASGASGSIAPLNSELEKLQKLLGELVTLLGNIECPLITVTASDIADASPRNPAPDCACGLVASPDAAPPSLSGAEAPVPIMEAKSILENSEHLTATGRI